MRFPVSACNLLPTLALPALLTLGCDADDPEPAGPNPAYDASDDASDGGTDAPDGASLDDAAPDVAPDVAPEVGSDAEDGNAGDAALRHFGLFVASNFATSAELSVVDLQVGSIVGHHSSTDQDTVIDGAGRRGFLLHRTLGLVSVLNGDAPHLVDQTIDVTPQDGGAANPWAVVVPAGDKAYVVRYSRNALAVIDTTTGAVTGEVDLSNYVEDNDGLVDAFDGVFDPASGRVYIGLQRIDQTVFGGPPDYVAPCTGTAAALVGIDTATDQVVDLNGAAAGTALPIEAINPGFMQWDAVHGRVVVLGAGCAATDADGGPSRPGRGLMAVDPDSGETTWLWQHTGLERPAGLIWVSPDDVFVAYDDASFTRSWLRGSVAGGFGASPLDWTMSVPAWDGDRGVVGLMSRGSGDGYDVVRYELDTGDTTTVAENVFTTQGVFAYGSVVLR